MCLWFPYPTERYSGWWVEPARDNSTTTSGSIQEASSIPRAWNSLHSLKGILQLNSQALILEKWTLMSTQQPIQKYHTTYTQIAGFFCYIHVYSLFFFIKHILVHLRFTTKLQERYIDFPHTPTLHMLCLPHYPHHSREWCIFFNKISLHWHIPIHQSPQFILMFTLDVVNSMYMNHIFYL